MGSIAEGILENAVHFFPRTIILLQIIDIYEAGMKYYLCVFVDESPLLSCDRCAVKLEQLVGKMTRWSTAKCFR